MDASTLEEFGFTREQIAKLPKKFVQFLFSYYSEIELKTLSVAAIVKGASILYSVYYPKEPPISPNSIISQ